MRFGRHKGVRGLQLFEECILHTAKRVQDLQRFEESVLSTAKHVGSLQSFGESILINAKCVEKASRALESEFSPLQSM